MSRTLALVALPFLLTGCPKNYPIDCDVEDCEIVEPAIEPCEGITPQVTNISPDELLAMLDDKDFQLINTHVPYAGEITGTDVHISYQDIDAIETYLDGDLEAKAVVYCLTGPMSEIAADELIARGYCNIFDMPQGMGVWDQLGYPMTE